MSMNSDKLKNIKIIAFDLDGTVFRNDKTISPRVRDTLRAAAERGIELVPATGRAFNGIPNELKAMPGVNYLITSNGAAVYRTDGSLVYERAVPCDTASAIISEFDRNSVITAAYFDGSGYMELRGFEKAIEMGLPSHAIEYFKTTRVMVDSLPEFVMESNKPVRVITLAFRPEDKAAQKNIIEIVKKYDVSCVYGGDMNIDINHRKSGKGYALLEIAKLLGIAPEDTAAIGDSENDSDMLKKAGVGIAMANADEDAKAAADMITLSNEEDGVAAAIDMINRA